MLVITEELHPNIVFWIKSFYVEYNFRVKCFLLAFASTLVAGKAEQNVEQLSIKYKMANNELSVQRAPFIH